MKFENDRMRLRALVKAEQASAGVGNKGFLAGQVIERALDYAKSWNSPGWCNRRTLVLDGLTTPLVGLNYRGKQYRADSQNGIATR